MFIAINYFKLVDTYGFPIELIKELAKNQNVQLDLEGFDSLFKQHQSDQQR